MERETRSGQTMATTYQIEEHKRALRKPPDVAEIARRQAVLVELVALRSELPPPDISITELLCLAQEAEDTALDG